LMVRGKFYHDFSDRSKNGLFISIRQSTLFTAIYPVHGPAWQKSKRDRYFFIQAFSRAVPQRHVSAASSWSFANNR
jgi:hypothetical protein